MKVSEKPSNKIKSCFVLLKRDSKPGKSISLVEVSSGPETMNKANKLVQGMLKGMRTGFAIKNRMSCKFCEFENTPHCT